MKSATRDFVSDIKEIARLAGLDQLTHAPEQIDTRTRRRVRALVRCTKWTPRKVQELLPDVQVRHHGKVVTMKTSFIDWEYASVISPVCSYNLEYYWDTIADALNNGTPLRQL